MSYAGLPLPLPLSHSLSLGIVWRLIGFMLFDFIVVVATKESAIKRLTCTACAAGCRDLGQGGRPIKQFLINLKRKMQKKKEKKLNKKKIRENKEKEVKAKAARAFNKDVKNVSHAN